MKMQHKGIWLALALVAALGGYVYAAEYTPLMPTGSRGAQTAITSSDTLVLPSATDLDDGTGDSPTLTLTDADDNTLVLQKLDGGAATVTNDEGALNILTSGDSDDYLNVSTSSDVPTIGTTGGCNLAVTADGGTVDFDNEAITTTGTVTGGTLTDGTVSFSSGTFSGIADLGTVTTADIDGGTIDGATIGGASAAAVTGTTVTGTTLTDGTASLSSGTFSGIADLGTVTTADIDGGNIDGATIGGNSAGAGTFTTLQATTSLTITEGGLADSTVVSADIKDGEVAVADCADALQDVIPQISATPTDDGDGTGSVSIQIQDAAGNSLSGVFAVRVWTGPTSYAAPSAITGFTTTTGTTIDTVTANADLYVVTNASGAAVIDTDNGGAGTIYVMSEIDGPVTSTQVDITAP